MVYNTQNFLKCSCARPALTSAIVPSSPWLAERMVEGVRLSQAKVVIEIGPGTGAFTRAIEKQISPSTFFMAVEIDEHFASHLKEQFPARSCHQPIPPNIWDKQLQALGHAFGRLRAERSAVVRDSRAKTSSACWARCIADCGRRVDDGLTHTTTPRAAGGRRFRKLLESTFSEVTTTRTEWRNLPPAFVYRCRK